MFRIINFIFITVALSYTKVTVAQISPSDFSNLQLWLKSDNVMLNAGAVEQWNDNSGNNFHLTQIAGNRRPLQVNNALNGFPVIRFDGLDDYLKCDFGTSFNQPNTIFLVLKLNSAADQYFFDGINSFNTLQYWSGSIRLFTGGTLLNYSQSFPFGYVVFSIEMNQTDSKIFQNSVLKTSGNLTNNSMNGITMGCYYGLAGYLDGDVAEFIVYDTVLTNSNRLLVEQYLMDKYAPPVNLGSDITISSGFCDTTLDAGTGFTNFLWSTGETTQTIDAGRTGSYWVEATSIFGNISRDTIQITYPNIPNPTGSIVCVGSTKLWDTGFPKSDFTFQWQDNSTDSVLSITTGGQYWVKITDSLGCYNYSDSITIAMDNFPSIASLGNDTSLCVGNSIYLQKGAGQATNYLWKDGSTNDSLTISIAGQYWVTVSNANLCNKTDTINITIAGLAPTADFSNTTTCFGNSTQFTDTSIPPGSNTITNWLWDFGEPSSGANNTSIMQNQSHTYADTGSYAVKLLVTTNAGCSASLTKTVIIYSNPAADFSNFLNCSGAFTQFTDLSSVIGSQITSWKWNFGDPSSGLNDSSTIQNASHQYNSTGNYNVKFIVTSTQGCKDSITKSVNVTPSITTLSPVLYKPYNKSQEFASSILFKWNSNTCNSSSQIIVSTDAAFANIVANQTLSADSFLLGGFSSGNTYYWKVRYFDGLSYSLWSSIYEFNVFFPSGIPGLTLWLSSDSVDVMNGKVATWYDKSGSNNIAIQADSSRRPKLIATDIKMNNQPVVKFDGVNDYLQFPDINDIKTAFFVFDHDPVYRAGDNLFGHSTNAPNSPLAGGLYRMFYYGATWMNKLYVNGVSSDPYELYQDSVYRIIELEPSPDGVANTISHNGFQGYNPWHGNIAEVLFYDRVLTSAERISLEGYLNNKYAPPVNLGPDINNSYGYCNTVLNAGSRFKSFLWSTGATTQSISVNKAGSYWVEVKNIFGYISRDTIEVSYPSIPLLTDSSIVCQGSIKLWDTGFPKGNYTFQWQDGSADSVLAITTAGQYWVKITDSLGCYQYSDTITVTVDSFPSLVSLGNDTSMCAGNSIYLQSGATQTVSYLWNDGSSNDSLQVTTTAPYWVTVSDINLCSKTDTINVTIAGQAPTAGYTSTITCIGNNTQFTDTSVPPGGDVISNWLWDFGEPSSGTNDTSTFQNPVHIYADTGSYTVKLLVTTNAGCSEEISKIVRVYPKPMAGFTAANLCSNAVVQFTNATSAYGYPIIQWTWNFGDPLSGSNNSSSIQNPVHVYVSAGTYQVLLIAENAYGCIDSAVQSVVIGELPVADFNYSTACKNSPVLFSDNSTLPSGTTIQSVNWDFGDNGTSSSLNPNHTFSANVNYTVTHVVTASNGCKDTAIKTIKVNPVPYAYFSTASACENTAVEFTDLSVMQGGTITQWIWDFGNGDTAMIQNSKYTFTGNGNKNVKLKVSSSDGCKDSITQTIVIHTLPAADFAFAPPYGTVPLTVNFTNTSTGAVSYLWDFGDLNQSTLVNPTHTYTSAGSYQIILTAINNFGCKDSLSKILEVLIPRLDVAITDIIPTLQNNYLNLNVEIANKGNEDVTSMEFYVRIKNGPAVKENWTGMLPISNIINYHLNSSLYVEDEKDYVCVSVLNPNSVSDEVAENNDLCKSMDDSEFKVLDIFPNPSKDLLTIPFIIPGEKMLTITIYNANGEIVKEAYSGYLGKGLQMLVINTVELTSGIYACRISFENKIVVKTFLKY